MGRPGQSYRILPKTKAKHGHLIKATPLTTLPLFPHTHTAYTHLTMEMRAQINEKSGQKGAKASLVEFGPSRVTLY